MQKQTTPVWEIFRHCEDTGLPYFKITSFSNIVCTAAEFSSRHRHGYFEIIWIKSGTGVHQVDMQEFAYSGPAVFVLSPGQIHRIIEQSPTEGDVIKFQAAVFPSEKEFKQYVLDTCLFDNISACPVLTVPPASAAEIAGIFAALTAEYSEPVHDSGEVISSYLKILITRLNRIKRTGVDEHLIVNNPQYDLFRRFKVAVEQQYKKLHGVQEYADLLEVPARNLNAVSRKYADKSAGAIIQERLLLEARRSLYHDTLTIKEICYDLGFEDPGYFTRFFKKHTGIAPQLYKQHR